MKRCVILLTGCLLSLNTAFAFIDSPDVSTPQGQLQVEELDENDILANFANEDEVSIEEIKYLFRDSNYRKLADVTIPSGKAVQSHIRFAVDKNSSVMQSLPTDLGGINLQEIALSQLVRIRNGVKLLGSYGLWTGNVIDPEAGTVVHKMAGVNKILLSGEVRKQRATDSGWAVILDYDVNEAINLESFGVSPLVAADLEAAVDQLGDIQSEMRHVVDGYYVGRVVVKVSITDPFQLISEPITLTVPVAYFVNRYDQN